MILDDIVAARREDLKKARSEWPVANLQARRTYAEPRRGFVRALRNSRPAIIAEVKKASPSRGIIRADFDPVAIATAYESAGAAAISVLTEERHFQGHLRFLEIIRGAVRLPLLRKDFIFDPYQIVEARAWGADAVLLIVAMLDDTQLAELHAASCEAGLDTLVEVHTRVELDRAMLLNPAAIGVNNRNLNTFVTTLSTCEELRHAIPKPIVAVAESGINTAADLRRLRAAGYEAFLVGETLMNAPDPGRKLRELLGGATGAS